MKLAKKSATVFDKILYYLAIVAAGIIIVTIIITTLEIFTRKVFNTSETWTVEVTEYCLLFMTLFGATWVLKEDGHVRIELLLARLGPKARTILNIITCVIGAFVCLVVLYYGLNVTLDQFQSGYRLPTALKPLAYYLTAVIPFGMLLLFIQFLRRIYGYSRKLRCEPEPESK